MPHLILLGDSIFDNATYSGGEPAVDSILREQLPDDWEISLLAVDGARIEDVAQQLAEAGGDATHLALSVGGNDALAHAEMLGEEVDTVAEALALLAGAARVFGSAYADLLDQAMLLDVPLAVCTIYDPRFENKMTRTIAIAGLAHFNDALLRQAFARGLTVFDLRLICRENDDFTLEIEPSAQGGRRIAATVARWAVDDSAALGGSEASIVIVREP